MHFASTPATVLLATMAINQWIEKIIIKVSTAFDGGTTLEINDGTTIIASTDNSLTFISQPQMFDIYKQYTSLTNINIILNKTGSVTAGIVDIILIPMDVI
jgi:hypothetical protein